MGLWPDLAADAEPIREIRVADGGSPLFLHYDHALVGDHPLGFIVENRVLRRALFARLARLPRLAHIAPAEVRAVEYGERAVATLADGRRIRARARRRGRRATLAAARGRRHPARDLVLSADRHRLHRAPRRAASRHRGRAFPARRALRHPADDRGAARRSCGPSGAALAPALLALDEAGFLAELARRFGDHLGALEIEGRRWSYELAFLYATRAAAPRLALVGEAAHVIHPIAGQGFNLGMRDVAALAELVVDARRLGLDIGHASVLERYAALRRLDALLLASVTDGLNRLFSNEIAPLRLARDLGLAAVDRVPPLKRLFMRHAMGIVGDVPRLARGEPLRGRGSAWRHDAWPRPGATSKRRLPGNRYARLRRRSAPRPNNAAPKSERDAGSGTVP